MICICALALLYGNRQLPPTATSIVVSLINSRQNQLPWNFGTCENFTEEVWRGFWRERKGLSKRDYLDRQEMDEKIRMVMKWPAKLYRNDSRLYEINIL